MSRRERAFTWAFLLWCVLVLGYAYISLILSIVNHLIGY